MKVKEIEYILESLENKYSKLPKGPWKFSKGDNFDHWELWSPSEGEWLVQDDSDVTLSEDFIKFLCDAKNDMDILINVCSDLIRYIDSLEAKTNEA
jgi:hypothetical protein